MLQKLRQAKVSLGLYAELYFLEHLWGVKKKKHQTWGVSIRIFTPKNMNKRLTGTVMQIIDT